MGMAKKRILLVHNFYQTGGGEHTVFENEKQLLLENGHEVYTYTRSNEELKKAKWKLLMLPLTAIWSVRTFFQVRRILRERDIHIVHCHNTFPLISPSVYSAARSRKIPVLQTIHNFRFLCPNGLFYCHGKICEQCRQQQSFAPAVRQRCYRNSALQTAVAAAMLCIHRYLGTYRKISCIFLTEFAKNKFEGLIDIHGDNVFVKPNFVYGSGAAAQRGQVRPKFVYAGRLDENKGIGFLLKVWPELPEEYELHLYGDGPCRTDCEAAAAAHRNIRFLGFRPRQEIFEDLADAAALVFPSVWYETFGMAWAESFALGCPVLSTDVGNHGEVVRTSRGGVVYERNSRDSFCAAAEEIVRHNARYSENALGYYQEHLTPARNYEKLSEIYEKARHIR